MTTKKERLEGLRRVPLFRSLSAGDLSLILDLSESRTIAPGAEIVMEGAEGNEFFVIEDGLASVIRGKRKVAELCPGDHFGEMSLLIEAPRNATVVADTEVRLLVLSRSAFLGLLGRMPDLAIKLLKEVAQRIRGTDTAAVH